MKKCKTFISVCTAFAFIVFMLSSCTSIEDDQVKEPTGVGSVRIKITRSGSAETRGGAAVSNPIEKGQTNAELNISTGGHLYFVNGSGIITKHVEILSSSSLTSTDGKTKIKLIDIKDTGGIIEDVPSSSSQVYIFLNLPATMTGLDVANTPFSTVESKVVTAVDLANPTYFDVANVPVSGSGTLVEHERTEAEAYDLETTANIELTAIAARIEIAGITAGSNASLDITSFALTGIFINYYHPSVTLGGTLTTPLQIAESNPIYFNAGNTQFFWRDETVTVTQGKYLYTTASVVDAQIGEYTSSSVTAGTGKVWGYNLLATGPVPHIVLKFSEVTLEDKTTHETKTLTDQFVTVTGFKKAEGGAAITTLERGIVYKLGGSGTFTFTPDNIDDVPEVTTIVAFVTAEVIDWDEENVDPVY